MKILFITSKEHIQQLKQDFEDVKNDYGLPCEIDPDFIETKTFRQTDSPGVAYYEDFQIQSGIPEIEIPPRYFQLSEQKFTLLHEMIHACQRPGSLKNLNKDYLVNLIHRLEKIQISMQFMNLYSSAMWKICEVDNNSLMEKINQPSYQKIWE